jgi:hypothetical protein
MLFIIIIIVIIGLIALYGKTPSTIKSHWQHFYDGCQISTTDFYNQIETGLRDRKIQGLNFGQESFLESHVFSAKRVYLRIAEQEYLFYICAAPFGTGTFVSWWLCIKDENFVNKIPILSKLAGKDRHNKSFYQMDTEAMYQSVIHSTVLSVADSLTKEKGVRELSELERQYKIGS